MGDVVKISFPEKKESLYFVLDGRTPRPVSAHAWAQQMRSAKERRVALYEANNVRVSTVFLGLNHNYGEGPPILFETLVFGGALNDEMRRYSTWDEAERGHAEIVERVKAASGGRIIDFDNL